MANMANNWTLAGKRVLVTGAASGIGRATAAAFARSGAQVILTDRDEAGVCAAAAEIGGVAQVCDVANESSVAACAAEVLKGGPLDVLVNNAGVAYIGGFMETPIEQWQRILQINVMGIVHCTRAFLPSMRIAGGRRHIVNVASAAAVLPAPNLTAYSASKGAVKLLTESLSLEMAGSGILAQTVYPGIINTPIISGINSAGANITAAQVETMRRYYATKGCDPSVVGEDIVKAVLSGKAHIFTGPMAALGHLVSRLSNRLARFLTLKAAPQSGYLP
jgi:NAD(P)-dependent dehydrogenase (short-subunit alcohol dehydrogenase family)